jgi:hypothetical protein
MPVGMDQLADDLLGETEALRALLVGLDDADWERPTPAQGWAVRDQISHLAYFDDAAVRSATDPDGFQADLRHVAHIGVRAMPFSYALNGRPAPSAPLRVELTSPSGELWSWGPEGAADLVRGRALDFCLLVTQRRHRDDLALEVAGPVATEWLAIAQAFAGEPGKGRAPLT